MSVHSLPRLATRTIAVARVWVLLALLGTYIPATAAAPRAAPSLQAAAPALEATKTAALLVDQDGDGNADAGDTLRYTVAISNTGSVDATGVAFNDLLDPNTSLVAGSTRVSPLAFADAYTVQRDTVRTVAAPGLLLNDTGTGLRVVAASLATVAGGNVAIATDGSFVYTPPTGYTGLDGFSYTVSNELGSDTAAVSIDAEGAPRILSTTPANNAADFPANANLVVTFDEPVELGANAFSLECGTAQAFAVAPTGPANSFTIDPVGSLPETAACVLTIVAAEVRDSDPLDPPDIMAADVSVAFTTTDAAPELTSTTPTDGAGDVAGDALIGVTFSEQVSASPTAFMLVCDAAVVPLLVSSSPSASFTLDPTSDLAAGANCIVSISASQVADIDAIDPPDSMLADASFSFTVDAAPLVTSTTPAAGASNVAGSTTITINFSESVSANAGAFTLVCDGNSRSITVSSSPASSFALTFTGALSAASVCTVTVLAANISDTDSNDPPDQMASDYTFNFTIDAAPSVSSITPASGSSNVATTSTITVGFSEPVDAPASAFALDCGGTSQSFTVSASPASSVTLTPDAALPSGTLCTLTVYATVSDADTNDPPDQMTTAASFTFTTDAAPTITSATPSATIVGTDANIVLTFSEAVNAPASAFSLVCAATSQPFVLSGAPGSVLTLDPTASLPEAANCAVTVTGTSVSDVDASDPPDTMLADYSFSFTTDAAPTVTSVAPANGATDVASSQDIVVSFSETVTANAASFELSCGGTAQPFTLAVLGTVYRLDPDANLPTGASCTVTVLAASVGDADLLDPPNTLAANVTATFQVIDDTAPSVTSTTPANSAANNGTGDNVAVSFSEPVAVNTAGIALSCGGTAQAIVSTVSGSILTINPDAALPEATNCTVVISAGSVTDADTIDPPDQMAVDYTFSFSTDAAPTVSSSTPMNGVSGVLTNADVSLVFSEPVNLNSNWFSLACASSGTRGPTDTVVSGGPNSFSVNPNADFAAGESCTMTVFAGQVTDADAGDPPDSMATNYSFAFTIEAAPSVISTVPTSDATNVATNANIVLTFSEAVNAPASAFSLVCAATSQPFVLSGAPGSVLTLDPTASLPEAANCAVTVTGTSVSDVDTSDPPDTMLADYSFSFTTDAAPTVTTTTPANGATSVAEASNITVNFSESVNADLSSFTVDCAGAQPFTLSASPSSSFTLDPISNLSAGTLCTVTVVAANVRDADAGDPPDTMAANYIFSFGVAPKAVNDGYSATGNVAITVAAPGVLANDLGTGAAVSAVQGASANIGVAVATSAGGSVTLNANGSFSYDPPAGVTSTTDTFTYQISSTAGNSNTATVTITLADLLWFVCDGCAGSNKGTLLNPFTSVAAFSVANTGATPAPQPNQKVYIRSGIYNAAGDTLVLRTGQSVFGQGTSASAVLTPAANSNSAFAALVAGARPVIEPPAANGVTLAQDNTLQHFNVGDTGSAGTDISGSNFGTLSVSNVSLLGTGRALDLNTGVLAASFGEISSTSSNSYGIAIQNASGSLTAISGSLAGAPLQQFYLNGGSASISYPGTITAANANSIILITAKNGGAVTLSGLVTATGNGIVLTNNTGAGIVFSGGLTLSTGTNTALSASGGGTVSVTGSNNTVATSTATAVNIQNTVIGAAGVTFRSISVNGAGTGILLNNTGSGGFGVTGTGSTAGSGGTIQIITNRGASFVGTGAVSLANMNFTNASTTNGAGTCTDLTLGSSSNTGCNAAIHLDTVSTATLDTLQINGGAQHGINARQVGNFTLRNSSIQNAGDGSGESGINALNLAGTALIDNTAISNSYENNLRVHNGQNTLNLTWSSTTPGAGRLNTSPNGSGALVTTAGTSNVTLAIRNTTVNDNFSGGLVIQSGDTSTLGVTLNGNTITNNNDGIEIGQQNSAIVSYTITSNTITNNDTLGINALTASTSTAGNRLSGTISGNTINVPASALGTNLQTHARGAGTHTTLIQNNTLTHSTQENGIYALSQDSGILNATILNNTVTSNPLAFHAILVQSGISAGGTGTVCADIRGNRATGTDSVGAGQYGIRVNARGTTTLNLVRNSSASGTATGVLTDNNSASSSWLASNAPPAVLNIVNSPCAQPLMAALGAGPGAASISQAQLDAAAVMARAQWAANGLDAAQRKLLDHSVVTLTDLVAGQLGGSAGTLVMIDHDAAGWGWSTAATPARGQIDLVSTIAHELGHVFGLPDLHDHNGTLMSAQLPTDTQRSVGATAAPSATLAYDIGTIPAGKRVVISFDVVIASPLPAGTFQIVNQATISAAGIAPVLTDDPALPGLADPTVTSLITLAYLPLVQSSETQLADLVVEQISTSPGILSVSIRNQGGTPVIEPFWVDAYINPRQAPTAVNQVWQQLGARGVVWGVTSTALPLAPGAVLTLTIGDAFYVAGESQLGGSIAVGTPIYIQVDSANVNTSYGAVLEGHERDGGPYNNISRTVALSVLPASANTAVPARATDSVALPAQR